MKSPVGEGKQRLLEALFDEFDENGPSPNLSIRYIAERLDVHHTLLTYHFWP
ncbi:Transcriptional regulator, TetR family [Cystobacter fuscus DSM 2262]|uniref:Transcriptional regulator, TetR family n=1 Tax=Cystobacter fuscus (strain ATCC 25194 / DSM 2262 / NBRC 100088 / M29) TaxID=1242864 RepID=S9PD68_CYSF2|nr:TetR/AcrR family transcriptional regulator [Cystobacter fuscus]EPX62330.1 Transcriptional regulator, TetR family [Cystobacter fuscus DSM 2262]